MKILVTGATGFIGNYVAGYLVEQGHEVIASSSSPVENIQHLAWADKAAYVQWKIGDLTDINLFKHFKEPDLAIHLAWSVLSDFRSLDHVTCVLPDHCRFLENLIDNGLKQLTVTGTCFEYGLQEGCLSEEMCSKPDNAYAKAKYSLFLFLEELQKQYDFELKWLRLFYMYGKGQSEKSLVPQLEKAVRSGDKVFNMSKGDQVRDYLPVEEVAQKIIKLGLQHNVSGIINCCSGKPVTVLEFVLDYIRSNNYNVELNPGYFPYSPLEPFKFWGSTLKSELALKEMQQA